MTTQSPEKLINDCPDIDFGQLKLYGIVTGDVVDPYQNGKYPLENPPDPPGDQKTFSALWRGYIAHYRLDHDGRLTLESYTYPNSHSLGRKNRTVVNERLLGDFWLVMRRAFKSPSTYVPFRDGLIITDRSQWRNRHA